MARDSTNPRFADRLELESQVARRETWPSLAWLGGVASLGCNDSFAAGVNRRCRSSLANGVAHMRLDIGDLDTEVKPTAMRTHLV